MRILLVAVLAVAVGGCSLVGVRSEEGERLARRATVAQILRSSVRVHVMSGETVKRAATGVVIDAVDAAGTMTSYVVTNEHVVEKADLTNVSYQVLVDQPGGARIYPAKLLAEGAIPTMDLAILEVPGVRLEAATLGTNDELGLGDSVVVVGAPYGRGLSISGGLLSQVEIGDGVPTQLKTDAAIGYGASGGGIFSAETGHLLGIIEGYRTAQVQIPGAEAESTGWSFDVPMPGETFASSVAKVRRFASEKHLPGSTLLTASR